MSRGFGTTSGAGTTDRITSALTTHAAQRTYSVFVLRNGDLGLGRIFDKGQGSVTPPELCFHNNFNSSYNYQRAFSSVVGEWRIPRPATGIFHHFAITYDASSTANDPIFYLNGVAQAVTEVAAPVGTLVSNGDPYQIGNRHLGTAVWDGQLYRFAVWNRILTPAEIASLSSGDSPLTMATSLVEYIAMSLADNPVVSGVLSAPAVVGTVATADVVFGPPVQLIPTNGPLTVHPTNGRYLRDASGKAVFLVGPNAYSVNMDVGPTDPPPLTDWTAWLAGMNAEGHNFQKFWQRENSKGEVVGAGGTYWSPPIWSRPANGPTTVGINGRLFTINGADTFLLGVSYYDVQFWNVNDLDAFRARKINLIRIWADAPTTWGNSGSPAAVGHKSLTSAGLWISNAIRDNLVACVDACNARGIVCDVVITNGGFDSGFTIPNTQAARQQAVATVAGTLKDRPNVIFNLANEHNDGNTDATYNTWAMHATVQTFAPGRLWYYSEQGAHFINKTTWAVDSTQRAAIAQHFTTWNEPICSADWAFATTDGWETQLGAWYTSLRAELTAIGKNTPIFLDEPPWGDVDTLAGPVTTSANWLSAVANAKAAGFAGFTLDILAGLRLYEGPFMSQVSAKALTVMDGAGVNVPAITGTAADGKPKYDLSQLNNQYFDRLRSRAVDCRAAGIYVSVLFFQAWSVDSKSTGEQTPWLTHPFRSINNLNSINGDPNANNEGVEVYEGGIPAIVALHDTYIQTIVARLGDLDNIIWEPINEVRESAASVAYVTRMISIIRAAETANGFSAKPMLISWMWPVPSNSNATILGIAGAQIVAPGSPPGNASERYGPEYDDTTPDIDPPVATGTRVISFDSDHNHNNPNLTPPQSVWDDGLVARQLFWKNTLRGAGILSMLRGADNDGLLGPMTATRVVLKAIRQTMQSLQSFVAMTPQNALASTGYCLANASAGGEYLVYLPTGGTPASPTPPGPVTMNLTGTPGTLNVVWINPSTGVLTTGSSVQGGSAGVVLTSPLGAGDAVVRLTSVVQGVLQFTDNGPLTPGVSYSYRVKAEDNAGNISDPSAPLVLTTVSLPGQDPPEPPTNLRLVSRTSTTLTFAFDPSVSADVVDYLILKDGEQVGLPIVP